MGAGKISHKEYELQCEVVKYLEKNGIPVFSCPNHLLHSGLAEAKREIAAGLRKGAPDLIAGVNGKSYWLELKTDKGRQSIEQKAFQDIAYMFGAEYIVVRTKEDLECLRKLKSVEPVE